MSRPEVFNLTSQYEQQVKPLIEQVREKCEAMGLNFLAVFEVEQTQDGETRLAVNADIEQTKSGALALCAEMVTAPSPMDFVTKSLLPILLRSAECNCPKCTARRERESATVQ